MKKSTKRLTTQEFIAKSKLIHGNTYVYSFVNYVNNRIKVKIICNLHGEFNQAPTDHLAKKGCPICAGRNKTTNTFIQESKLIHGDKYDYSLSKYTKAHDLIIIICKKHGLFNQKAYSHLAGKGCYECGGTKKYSTEKFIKKAIEVHGNIYDYSLTKYKTSHERIKIICKTHGEYMQLPYTHIQGFGCAQCAESKGEKEINNFLLTKKIIFEKQKTFKECKDKRLLKFDFFLPAFNMCIEFDGIQHFEPIKQFGGEKEYLNIKKRDKIKTNYCKKHNIKLIRIKYSDIISKKLSFYFK